MVSIASNYEVSINLELSFLGKRKKKKRTAYNFQTMAMNSFVTYTT